MEAERSIHCSILCDIITKTNLGQRYKRELVHLQHRLFSTLSAQLTLQYSSSRHCGNAHPCTTKAGQLLGFHFPSGQRRKKPHMTNSDTFQSPLCSARTYYTFLLSLTLQNKITAVRQNVFLDTSYFTDTGRKIETKEKKNISHKRLSP